ncbi:hypothetical protein VIGAN_03155800 [Vigna angularis var. angularis]|uniref:Uncharacterized protein n=1 Tax=Vigna angularis var. angularis TaxID=157739 RepID=A0A0S3RMH1_PHAAN|nr:hypothetical protein VIGAN_03155800 [Vigna angularis var. angularis]
MHMGVVYALEKGCDTQQLWSPATAAHGFGFQHIQPREAKHTAHTLSSNCMKRQPWSNKFGDGAGHAGSKEGAHNSLTRRLHGHGPEKRPSILHPAFTGHASSKEVQSTRPGPREVQQRSPH